MALVVVAGRRCTHTVCTQSSTTTVLYLEYPTIRPIPGEKYPPFGGVIGGEREVANRAPSVMSSGWPGRLPGTLAGSRPPRPRPSRARVLSALFFKLRWKIRSNCGGVCRRAGITSLSPIPLFALLGALGRCLRSSRAVPMPAGGDVDGDLLARANTVASSAGGESRQGAGSEYSDYYYSDYEGGGKAEEGGTSGSNQYTPRSGADSAAPSGEGAGTCRSAYSSEPPGNNTNRSAGSQLGTARSGAGGSTDRSGGSAPAGYPGSDPAAETARSGYSGDPPFSWFEMAAQLTTARLRPALQDGPGSACSLGLQSCSILDVPLLNLQV